MGRAKTNFMLELRHPLMQKKQNIKVWSTFTLFLTLQWVCMVLVTKEIMYSFLYSFVRIHAKI